MDLLSCEVMVNILSFLPSHFIWKNIRNINKKYEELSLYTLRKKLIKLQSNNINAVNYMENNRIPYELILDNFKNVNFKYLHIFKCRKNINLLSLKSCINLVTLDCREI